MNAWIQFSSGQGPCECERVLWHIFKIFCREAENENIQCELIKAEKGSEKNSFRSLLISLEGNQLETLRKNWEGSLLWRAPSPFRPNHKRRNWFVQASFLRSPQKLNLIYRKSNLKLNGGRVLVASMLTNVLPLLELIMHH